jgi:hypothetical protein
MSMRILSGLRMMIKERRALAALRLSIFIVFSLQSSCVVVGVLHYRHKWENGYSDRHEVVDEHSLRARAHDVEEYEGATLYYFHHGWSWNYVGPWILLPIGIPYPNREQSVIIVKDGIILARLDRYDSSDTSTFYGLKCNFVPVPMVQVGCSWGCTDGGSGWDPRQIVREYNRR